MGWKNIDRSLSTTLSGELMNSNRKLGPYVQIFIGMCVWVSNCALETSINPTFDINVRDIELIGSLQYSNSKNYFWFKWNRSHVRMNGRTNCSETKSEIEWVSKCTKRFFCNIIHIKMHTYVHKYENKRDEWSARREVF